jgi:polysaccharide biosynthesis protein PslG
LTRSLARILAVACLIACAALAAPSSSSAKVLVGIGDQNAVGMFDNPLFQQLKIKRSRVIVPWNVAQKRRDRVSLDNWLKLAKAAHVEPLVHFAAATGSRCAHGATSRCRLPTVRQYTAAFKAFRKHYSSIRIVGAWNEANVRSQPTFKNPKRAAEYFNVVRKYCRGCKIVAADVLDDPNMVRWLTVFKKTARGARVWGLHNYRDSNPRKGQLTGGTRRLLRAVRGQVWFTETGGIAKFVLPNRHTLFPFSESRQNTAIKKMFSLAKRYRSRVKRVYIYNWRAPIKSGRFDSGLIRHDKITDPSARRPAYFTVQRNLRTSSFGP